MEDKALFRVRGCIYKPCRCMSLLVKMSHYHCLTFARAIYNWICKNDCLKRIKTVRTKGFNSSTLHSHNSSVRGYFGSFLNSFLILCSLKNVNYKRRRGQMCKRLAQAISSTRSLGVECVAREGCVDA